MGILKIMAGFLFCTTGGENSGNICNTTNYGVTRSRNRKFDGYAWSEHIGWISFNCKTGCEIPNKDGCGVQYLFGFRL